MRTKESIIEEIIQFFKDNKSVFTTAIEDIPTIRKNADLEQLFNELEAFD